MGNGWYKLTVTFTLASTGTFVVAIGALPDGETSQIWFPTNDFNGAYFWGAQLEQGSFPTSYIKTTGSQVTRSADTGSLDTTLDWFNLSEGTFYVNAKFQLESSAAGIGSYSNSTNRNGFSRSGSGWQFYVDTINDAATISNRLFDSTTGYALGNEVKLAGVYKIGEYTGISVNGFFELGTVKTLNNGVYVPNNTLYFAKLGSEESSYIKKISFYPTRLTSNEIQDLTEE